MTLRESGAHTSDLVEETHILSQKIMTRRELLSLALSAVSIGACSKIDQLLGKEKEQTVEQSPQKAAEPALKIDQNRPEFLDEDGIELTGLTLMMGNNDKFDRYVFNAVTGNKSHAQTCEIQKGYTFEFNDGRKFTMPYHSFLFRAFDPRSNLHLPERLGKVAEDLGLSNFFREYTVYKADNPKHIEAIKTILITSYELSFGVKLDPSKIKIEGDVNGEIKAIKYASKLTASTTISKETEQDTLDPEAKNILSTEERNWDLVGKDGELLFPPTIVAKQGIAIPHSALHKYPQIQYAKSFKSQGKRIDINMSISVDAVLEEQNKLTAQNRPQTFEIEPELVTKNWGHYVLENDPFTNDLARVITEGFRTKREKMQAILDFVHSQNYVPDAYGEAPRTPRVTLISKGGDCEDSSILVVSLARAVGIDCIFAYFDMHAAPVCDIGESGTAFTWGDKKYEWCETTGGKEAVVTVITYQDSLTKKIIKKERTARGWKIGEKPDNIGPIRFVSRVEDDRLTKF